MGSVSIIAPLISSNDRRIEIKQSPCGLIVAEQRSQESDAGPIFPECKVGGLSLLAVIGGGQFGGNGQRRVNRAKNTKHRIVIDVCMPFPFNRPLVPVA